MKWPRLEKRRSDGFGEAHAVVLDPNGQFGYATDGLENVIRVFDRRTFRIAGMGESLVWANAMSLRRQYSKNGSVP